MRDGQEYIEEQRHPTPRAKLARFAPAVDRQAIHVLEDKVWLVSVAMHTGIEQARDVRMVEPAEQQALAPKALFPVATERAEIQELDRGESLVAAVVTAGTPHAAHAATTDLLFDGPRPEPRADQGSRRRTQQLAG